MDFVHLHVHSNYSFCRGANTIEEICRAARARGMDTLALTDTGGFYGLVWFLQAARAQGLTPLVGAHVSDDRHAAVLLAKSRAGYAEICRLVTARHAALSEHRATFGTAAYPGSPRTRRLALERGEGEATMPYAHSAPPGHPAPAEPGPASYPGFSLAAWLAQHGEEVVIISPDFELLDALARGRGTSDLYVELGPGERGRALAFARRRGLAPVATNAVYLVNPEDYPRHRLLRAIDLNRPLGAVPPGELAHPEAWLKPPRLMHARFPDCPESLANTRRIAEACRFDFPLGGAVFPGAGGHTDGNGNGNITENAARDTGGVPTGRSAEIRSAETDRSSAERRGNGSFDGKPAEQRWGGSAGGAVAEGSGGNTSEGATEEKRGGNADGNPAEQRSNAETPEGDLSIERLERLCREGLRRRYGRETPAALRRLEHELGIVRAKGFAPYFLIVHDVVRHAPLTCGRGSRRRASSPTPWA